MEDERDAQDAIRGLDQIEFGRKCRRLRVEWSKEERGSRRSNLRPSKTLFVINFDSLHTSTSDLERHFDRYGKVLNVRIRRNYAFIQYDVQEDATRALEATNLSKLMDRIISVEYATKEDDNWRDGCSPDRVRDRSPGRRDYSRGRSPSPYRRVRASPSYGRGPSPNQGERASPDYGHRRSSIGYHKSKDNDHHGRSPLRGGRLSSNNKDDEFGPIENIGSLSPKRETSRSPLRGGSFGPYDIDEEELASREKKCILRVRSRSPPRGWKHSANYNDNEPAPRENTHSLSLKRKRSRSPLRGERHSPDDNDDETAPRENSRSLSPERKRNRIQNDSYRSPYPDPRIDARTSRTNYGAVSSEVVGYERF